MTQDRQDGDDPGLMEPGRTVWRVAQADRFAVLMENEAYFDALSSAIDKAERSIVVLGWQFDPRTRLDPETRPGDKQAEIGHKLRLLVKARPELDVRLLIWKSPLLIAASQGFYPHRAQGWFRKRMVEFRMDQAGPLGACHHQKVVVIDDRIAFCGGGDIATDRWDSAEHLDADPRRCQPSGVVCSPRHEVMTVMDGAAAKALGDLARERWFRATWERTIPDETDNDPWPDGVTPDLTNVPVGIARTEPKWGGRGEVRENQHLYVRAIAGAKRLIYLENQYFTSPVIAEALARSLARPEGPEIVLVSTGTSPSWFDGITMDTARAEVLYRLEQADVHGRFFAFAPYSKGHERIIVHAKVAMFDDRWLRVGSTNLNNRSFGFDTEVDVITDAGENSEAVRAFRQRSIAHFVGVAPEVFAAAEQSCGSVGQAIQGFDTGRMVVLGSEAPTWLDRTIAEWQLGDPAASTDAFQPWKRRRSYQLPVRKAHWGRG